jgi:FixJ family two-component response regulator
MDDSRMRDPPEIAAHIPDVAPVVFIIDDDESIRRGVGSILRSVGYATREFGCADDFLNMTPTDAPCCVILDIRLPGMSGLALQSHVPFRQLDIPVIMITGHGDIAMSVRALKAGALDFLTKPFRDQDVLDAVAAAIEKDRARRDNDRKLHGLLDRYRTLTAREREVFRLVCKGLMNKQIAADIGLTEITVKIHRGRMMKKMLARSLPDLVRTAEALKAHIR